MPNWCNNDLVITHEDKEKIRSLEEVVVNYIEGGEKGKFFGHILPEPEYAEEKSGTMPDWWHWRVENWGTKWEASFGSNTSGFSPVKGTMIVNGELRLNFDTAWAPPIGVIQELLKQGFNVEHIYMEQGMDFWGWEINGKEIHNGSMSEYAVDKFGNTYSEWDELPDGATGKGEAKEVTGASGNYTWTEYEHEWSFHTESSKKKALSIGISEKTWNKCDLATIRGG